MPLSSVLGAQSLVRPGVCTSTTRPASPFTGQVIYESDTKQTAIYSGTAWVMIADLDTPPGLELVKTQTVGSAVSSVTVTNAFSSVYDNYRIVMNSTGSGSHSIDLKLGASATAYYGSLLYVDATVGTIQVATRNNQTQLNWLGGCQGANQPSVTSFDIFNPFAAVYTRIANGAYQDGSAYGIMQGEHRVATSYTDFTLTTNSGATLTGGTVRVYGYRNS